MGQPHLIKNLENKFGNLVAGLQRYRTPGTPVVGVTRPKKNEKLCLVSTDDQGLYRSGVRMLLYLVNHSPPDITNVTRELSKVMDGATPLKKAMKRLITFVLDTLKPVD